MAVAAILIFMSVAIVVCFRYGWHPLDMCKSKMNQPKIIVVGGGLAGLMATIQVAEAGVPVDLFPSCP